MSTPKLIDAHTHVHFAAFKDDADAVIQRARDAGIWMINVGTQRDTSVAAIACAKCYEGVWATVGLHPIHAEKTYHDPQELGELPLSNSREFENRGFVSRGEEFEYDYYKKLALHPKVVGIGECGLDYYRVTSDKRQETRNKQKNTLMRHIELAKEIKKPLMIHCRNAFDDLIDILVACRVSHVSRPGVVHFFSGTKDDARRLMDLGFSFTFGGVVTFARDYDAVIRFIGIDRILVETDAPYVAPAPYRGRRNEPLYVVEVAKKLAEILGIDVERISEATVQNTRDIFNLKPSEN